MSDSEDEEEEEEEEDSLTRWGVWYMQQTFLYIRVSGLGPWGKKRGLGNGT